MRSRSCRTIGGIDGGKIGPRVAEELVTAPVMDRSNPRIFLASPCIRLSPPMSGECCSGHAGKAGAQDIDLRQGAGNTPDQYSRNGRCGPRPNRQDLRAMGRRRGELPACRRKPAQYTSAHGRRRSHRSFATQFWYSLPTRRPVRPLVERPAEPRRICGQGLEPWFRRGSGFHLASSCARRRAHAAASPMLTPNERRDSFRRDPRRDRKCVKIPTRHAMGVLSTGEMRVFFIDRRHRQSVAE